MATQRTGDIKPLEGLTLGTILPNLSIRTLLDLHFNHYIATMFTGGLPGFNINDLTAFDNNNYDDKFSFDGFDWEILSNVAGPSQPYTGVDVQGDLNAYPEFPSPSSAPTSLYPAQGAIPNEGKLCCTS